MVDISRWTSSINMPPVRTKRRGAEPFLFTRKPLALQRGLRELSSRKAERLRANAMNSGETIHELLGGLVARCERNLASDQQALGFLKNNGIHDVAAAKALRAGVCDSRMYGELDDAAWMLLAEAGMARIKAAGVLDGSGLVLPTCDPRKPETITGLIVQRFCQNKHDFATRPAGVACSTDVATATRIIVTDAPLLALRMIQAGVRGVVVAQTPEVLTPISDWLMEREIAIVGYKRNSLQALKNALGEKGNSVNVALVHAQFEKSRIETFLLLGLPTGIVETPRTAKIECAIEPVEAQAAQPPQENLNATPELIRHDEKTNETVFGAGSLTYSVEAAHDGATKGNVRVERNGLVHVDRFSLSIEAQRKRFASSAAAKLGVPSDLIEAHLASIMDELRKRIQEELQAESPPASITDSQKSAALAELCRPDLLDAIAAELEELGWVGEDTSKRLLYLAAISRKLPCPLSIALAASPGAEKSTFVETIAELTPPEDLLHVSRLTDFALYYQEKNALRHKLLVIDEASRLTNDVLVSLRVLQNRGALSQSHVLKDPFNGTVNASFIEVRGPVAVLMAGTLNQSHNELSRCFEVTVDESVEQTQRVLKAQRRLRQSTDFHGLNGRRAKLIAKHQAMQRMLRCGPVLIPYADRIEFPATSIRHRHEQDRFLNVIEASALLHQHQRKTQKIATGEEYVIADLRDYEIALALAGPFVTRSASGLSTNAEEILQVIREGKWTTFGMDDLQALRPDWTRYRFRAGLNELLKVEILTSPSGGRGKLRSYKVNAMAMQLLDSANMRLLSGHEVGGLAKVGETASPTLLLGRQRVG